MKLTQFALFTFAILIMVSSYFLSATFILISAMQQALAATYYSPQTNFEENEVPLASYKWNKEGIDGCIYKEEDIYNSYKDFPDYPNQTGAYTATEYQNGIPSVIHIYLSPVVLHGDGHTEIDLP